MNSSPHLIFKSDSFPAVPGEDEETNPGIFGVALVEWLSKSLAARGHGIVGAIAEDFGRVIRIEEPACSLYVAASSTDDTATEWRVFAVAEAGLLARLKGKRADRVAKVNALFEELRTILSADGRIRDLHSEN
jgi:hypothetical protein